MKLEKLINEDTAKTLSTAQMVEITEELSEYIDCGHTNKDKLLRHIDIIVNGPEFSHEMAEEVCSKFKNTATGKTGPHWSMVETNSVMSSNRLSYPASNFYVLLNMLYSDYSAVLDEEHIIAIAIEKTKDIDVKEDWLKKYIFHNQD